MKTSKYFSMKKFLITLIKKFNLHPNDKGVWNFFGKPILIGFYEHDYYVFSNFSSFQIEMDGKLYPTSEHLYHTYKFTDENIKEKVRLAKSAHEAFYVAHEHRASRRADWDDVKASVMKKILIAKVEQHPYVKKKLIASKGIDLVENSWRDDVWGWGEKRDGKNLLGNLWMEVRSEMGYN